MPTCIERARLAMRPVMVVIIGVALLGCDPYPRDPEQTLDTVRGGVLQAGAVHDPPFVVVQPGQPPTGAEVRVIEALAAYLDARVNWHVDTHERQLRQLEGFALDIVVGGAATDTPWKERVALTEPFRDSDAHGTPAMRVFALPPGENAWRMEVEAYLRSDEARSVLRARANHDGSAP